MSGWLNGFFSGTYQVSTGTWSGYGNHLGQVDSDNTFFNESVSLPINPSATVTSFLCSMSQVFGPTGSGPPCFVRIRAVKNSLLLVTSAGSAAVALSALTTAFVDVTIPDSNPIALNLTAIAQEVINEAHWANGNKITFVMQGTVVGMKSVFPDWFTDSYGIGGGGGGGQSGVNGSFLLSMMTDEYQL